MQEFYSKKLDDVYKNFNSSSQGLTSEEASIRLEKNGKNALKEAKKQSLISRFFAQFKDVMILVLLVAALISAVLAIVESNYTDLIDSGIILFIVILNAVIGLIQENKADAAMDALKNMNKSFSKVFRDGKVVHIPSEEIVVGDVVVLEAGDIVPADIRLIDSASLKVEEAALTGESVPAEKDATAVVKEGSALGDRKNMAYSSGIVSYGRATGVVTAIGMDTEVGKIATMLNNETREDSPLQKQLAKTAKVISVAVLGIALVIFLILGIRSGFDNLDEIISAFMIAVAIAVAAIPEGLPAVVTIVLAMGVSKMAKKRAIVKNLPSVETLGCCEIICSDKTGTLTLNKMTVKELYTNEKIASADEVTSDKEYELLVRTLALCNDTQESEGSLVGDPTETALVQYLIDCKKTFADLKNLWQRVDEIPFDSIRKLMTTVNKNGKESIAYVKGAPDVLLSKCTKIMTKEGVRPITEKDKEHIISANKKMADKALRVLGGAIKTENLIDKKSLEQDLTFVGLVGMIDPPRAEVKDAVATCLKAGIRPLMITGDHADTASAIAREIGILQDGQKVMNGVEIDSYSDEEFVKIIQEYSVFARVSPENKVRIVKAYKSLGKVVAMTGDGVNDAPSIKSADIGIGMGITGTDVSKGAADMVLADDNFATIVGAVEEGRKIFSNITKAIQFLLSANIAEVLCLLVVTLAVPNASFLTAVMILWVNLVTDSLPALALGTEPAENDVMLHKPRKADKSLFAGKMGIDIIIQGIMQTSLVLLSYFTGYYAFNDSVVATTMAFLTLCLIQLCHSYNLRSKNNSIFGKHIFENKFLNISFLVGCILTILPIAIPGVNDVFGACSLNLLETLIAVGCSFVIIPFVEIQKFIERRIVKRKHIDLI